MMNKEVIANFSTNSQFIDLNKSSDLAKVLSECEKLKELANYPNVVKSKIEDTKEAIRLLEKEIQQDLNKQLSFLSKVKRKQELQYKYDELKELRNNLASSKEELLSAYKTRDLANQKLSMYEDLIAKFNGQEV